MEREERKMQLPSWWTAEEVTPTSDDESEDWYGEDDWHAAAVTNVSAEHVTQHVSAEHATQFVSAEHVTQHAAEHVTQHAAEHATQHSIADGHATHGNVTQSATRLAQLNATAVHYNKGWMPISGCPWRGRR